MGPILRGWLAKGTDTPKRDGSWESITDGDMAADAADFEAYRAAFVAAAEASE